MTLSDTDNVSVAPRVLISLRWDAPNYRYWRKRGRDLQIHGFSCEREGGTFLYMGSAVRERAGMSITAEIEVYRDNASIPNALSSLCLRGC